MNFCYFNKMNRHKLYNVLFSLITLFYLPNLDSIFINTILSIFVYTNILIVSNYSILRSNLTINTSKIRKNIIIKVIALIDRL